MKAKRTTTSTSRPSTTASTFSIPSHWYGCPEAYDADYDALRMEELDAAEYALHLEVQAELDAEARMDYAPDSELPF